MSFVSKITAEDIINEERGPGGIREPLSPKVKAELERYAKHLMGNLTEGTKEKILDLFPVEMAYEHSNGSFEERFFEIYRRLKDNGTKDTFDKLSELHQKSKEGAYKGLAEPDVLYDIYLISKTTNIPINYIASSRIRGNSLEPIRPEWWKQAILSENKIPVYDRLLISELSPNRYEQTVQGSSVTKKSSSFDIPDFKNPLISGHMLKEDNDQIPIPASPKPGEVQILTTKKINAPSTTQTLYDVSSPTGVAIPKSVHHSLLPLKNQDWTGYEGYELEDIVGNNYVRFENITDIDDGDTVTIGRDAVLRLQGIDTPEKWQPHGERAKQALKKLINGRPLVVKIIKKEDKGRYVAYLYDAETGTNLNVEMVRVGYAYVYRDFLDEVDPEIRDQLLEAEAQAIAEADLIGRKGSIHHPEAVKPWDSRRERNPNGSTYDGIGLHPFANTGRGDKTSATINSEGHGSPFDDEALEYAEDHEMSTKSPYEHMHGEASIAHLSRLYDSYYSSADVKVWMKVEGSSNKVMVDLLTGIGYSLSSNSMPVYTIGSRFPIFFTRGNTIGNGTLVVPFKHAKYLRAMLKYVFDESDTGSQSALKKKYEGDPDKATDEDFLNEVYTGEIDEGDIIDVGAVVTPFDLEIRFDNSNAFGRDQHKSKIILKGCKLTGESTDVASTRDGAIQVGYNFLFKTAVSGDAYEYIS